MDRRESVEVILYRSEEHTSELQSHSELVCRLLLEKKKKKNKEKNNIDSLHGVSINPLNSQKLNTGKLRTSRHKQKHVHMKQTVAK